MVRVFGSVARDEETPESALAGFEPGRSLPDHIVQNLQDLPGREIGVVTRGEDCTGTSGTAPLCDVVPL